MELNKYVAIKDGVVIYQYPDEQYIAVIIKKVNGNVKRYIKDVKSDAIKVLRLIDGRATVQEFMHHVKNKYNAEENELQKFVEDSIKTGIIELKDECKEKYLTVVGDGELILPRHATIEITELCNLKCIYCYNEASPNKGRHMTLENILKVFKILSEHGVTVIEISGGEPMIHPQIVEILKAAFEYFDWVAVISNGVFFPEKVIPVLHENKSKFGGVQISIDGSCEEINQRMRQVPNTFHKTLETITLLKNEGFLVRVVIVLTEENIDDIEDTCALMKKMGVKHFGISISEEWGRGKDILPKNNQQNRETTYRNYFREKYGEILKKVNDEYNDIIFNDKILKNVDLSKIKNCGAGWQTIAVTTVGDIEICAPGKIVLGNIFEENYSDIFSSELVQKLQKVNFKEVRQDVCLKCVDAADCAMCFSKVIEINKRRLLQGRPICQVIKRFCLEELIYNENNRCENCCNR